ncbi:transcription factor IIA subunit alpha [Orbilia brochopaga]|uniref:Transcription factor IIA subunit alpha n=1 Tax=Orbilia brochopaga TaxID=3140254 RepID=A0AAV9UCB6_9PEZI
MTNNGVGKVYEKVIQQVIDSSVTDVHDSGIDAAVLEELKKVWQGKLSAFKVASFPWDPEPVPSPAPKPEETVDASGEMAVDGTRIKTEDSILPPPPPPAPLGQPLSDPSIAAARAREAVEKKLVASQQQQQRAFTGLMLPTPPQHHLSGHTDGPDDALSRLEADDEIRRIVLEGEQIRTYEDAIGEAMRRFDIQSDVLQARPLNKKRKDRQVQVDDVTMSAASPLSIAGPSTAPRVLPTDGPEMDDDEDAINSDLDDSDEEQPDDDDDGEGIPQIMLCMYDKVQRTKNKWKCVLRHGVLTVNGKEYVFQKATGEYEW